MSILNPGDKVRLKANPARVGILGNETDGPAHRQRVLVSFLDGSEDFVLPSTLEKVENKPLRPYECIERGRFSGEDDLRAANARLVAEYREHVAGVRRELEAVERDFGGNG